MHAIFSFSLTSASPPLDLADDREPTTDGTFLRY
jgi:hypothetical protein